MTERASDPSIGDVVELVVGKVAHGGHCVAHLDGRAVFVRHAIPGERVRARITGVGRRGRYLTADVVEVVEPDSDRVDPPCAYAGSCGGCDFQHIAVPRQRELKSQVLHEALQRFAHLPEDDLGRLDLSVYPVAPGAESGLHWRSRVRMVADPAGRLGFRAHRSHEIVPVRGCAVATERLNAVLADSWSGDEGRQPGSEWVLVDPDGRPAGAWPAEATSPRLPRRAIGIEFPVPPAGFWQAHRGIPDALVKTVLEFGAPAEGEHVWDLYAGSGLLSVPLAWAVGATGYVHAVEGDAVAVRTARRVAHDLPQLRLHEESVERWLASPAAQSSKDGPGVDLVVLDPPRRGARRQVMDAITRHAPSRLVYVACDPVAFARDVCLATEHGYRLDAVRAMDAFPMTGQFETVGLLNRE